jgi:very-short-patch-repair endonuclease
MKKINIDYNLLKQLYLDEKKNITEISIIMNCSPMCISRRLKLYRIETRKSHVAWNKDKPGCFTEGTLKQMSENSKGQIPWNLNKHDHLTKDQIKNLSDSHIGQISNKKGKSNIEMYGFEKAEELKIKNREKTIKQHENGTFKKYDTNIERKIENYFLFNDVLYVKQYPYKLGIADFWLPESNTIVECDGDYWHGLPNYKERDKKQTKWLLEHDYRVLRFSESKILNNFDSVISKIRG